MLQKRLSAIPVKISVLSGTPIPEKSLNGKRNQYDCKHFLKLVRGYPGDKVLGITEVDLYAETLNFVFGHLFIRMQSGHQPGNTNESKQHRQKSNYRYIGRFSPAPARGKTGM